MSKEAIDYLKENKNKYSKEKLVEALKQAGYQLGDIVESLNSVYENEIKTPEESGELTETNDFWNIKSKFVYKNPLHRLADLVIGFISPWILVWALAMFDDDFIWMAGVAYIVGVIYFKNRRYYIFRGLIINIYIIMALVGLAILFFGLGWGRYIF